MTLTTNGIDIDKLNFTPQKIVVKSLKEYQEDIKKTIKQIKEDGKKGYAIFKDNEVVSFSKPKIEMDF